MTTPNLGTTKPEGSGSPPRRFATILQNAIAVLVIGGFGLYLWRRREVLGQTLDVSFGDLAFVGISVVLTWVVASLQTWVLYRAEDLEIGVFENLLLTVTSAAVNYLPFRLGTVIRFRYLKAVHGLRYTRSVSVAGIRLTLLVVVTGALGLIGVLGLWIATGSFAPELGAIFAVLLVGSSIAALQKPRVSEAKGPLVRTWNDFSGGFAVIRDRPAVAIKVLALILLQLLLMAVRFHIGLQIVGGEAAPYTLLMLAPTATLASFVSIVPGGLGLREGVMGYVTLATGQSFDSGLFAGTMDRAVLLVLLLGLGSASLAYIWMRLRRAEREAGF